VTDVRILVGDRIVDRIKPADRGLAYGDGVFETLRVHAGRAIWWDAHWERLALGAACLGIPLPDEAKSRAHIDALIAGQHDDAIKIGVLKIVLTRGAGGRGYAPPIDLQPTMIISLHRAPLGPTPVEGIAVRWCETRLAIQRALAGIKHCNRLEQVLARAEWNDAPVAGKPVADQEIHEGLMRDTEGFAVCATAANLFVLRDGRWSTPLVDRCGVAGVCREWILEHADTNECRLTVDDLETADAIFLCNSVRGILPVAALGDRRWSPHPRTTQLQQMLADAEPGFGMRNGDND
jgi:4-amino-4-deoxychorismate lyase